MVVAFSVAVALATAPAAPVVPLLCGNWFDRTSGKLVRPLIPPMTAVPSGNPASPVPAAAAAAVAAVPAALVPDENCCGCIEARALDVLLFSYKTGDRSDK